MRALVCIIFVLTSLQVCAGGYSAWAVPTELEYVNDGVLISGAFGNPNSCTDTNKIFFSRTNLENEKFQSILSFVLTALTAEKEIRA
jgi:hypothetical protein